MRIFSFFFDRLILSLAMLVALSATATAQLRIGEKLKKKDVKKSGRIISDTLLYVSEDDIPTLDLNPYAQKEEKKIKKKKRKKKVFYGDKTKVRYTKEIARNSIIIEKFHVPKVHKDPSPYVYDVYYYNVQKRVIEKTNNYKTTLGPLLHGAYKRMVDGQVVEQGLFYYGGKDGRWERYGQDMLLVDKEYYFHGFPKNSQITYYDKDQKKIKEVIPVQYLRKDGMYLHFYESGQLAEVGMYVDDIKVGRWLEYYDRNRPNNKKETQHGNPNKPYDPYEPKVLREWDTQGKKVVDVNEQGRRN
jgi:hypothetical protein